MFLQLASIVTESTRLVVVQKLLQSRGLKLNPITTLYYVRGARGRWVCLGEGGGRVCGVGWGGGVSRVSGS